MNKIKCYFFGHPPNPEAPATIPPECCCDQIDARLPFLRVLVWFACLLIVIAYLVPVTLKDLAVLIWRNSRR
jgi:hypothetical protein